MCVCAYPGVEFLCRLIRRPYLLSKRRHCRVERTTIDPAFAYINTHTHRVIVYACSPTNSMTTCRPASVLLLIHDASYQSPTNVKKLTIRHNKLLSVTAIRRTLFIMSNLCLGSKLPRLYVVFTVYYVLTILYVCVHK